MLKYLSSTITFAEFPNEIALCLNITNCPCYCNNCSEPELREDSGSELTLDEIDRLIQNNKGITVIGFMGGDSDHEYVAYLARYIHEKWKIKVGMYSGYDYLDPILLSSLDIYKIGRWIMPKGEVDTWCKQNCGPLKFPFSNQLYFVKNDKGLWMNKTELFRLEIINNLEREIIQ